MRKKLFHMGIFFIMCFIFALGKVENAQAATGYKAIYANSSEGKKSRTVGNTTFEFDYDSHKLYAIKNGKRTLLASAEGLSSEILTNGKVVYYCVVYQCAGNYYQSTATVYQISSIGEKGKRLFTTKMGEDFAFVGLYKGKLYYQKGIDPGKFCSYTFKSKRQKTLANDVTGVRQYKLYFYLTPYEGDAGPLPLRVYNAKNNKVKIISKGQIKYDIVDGHLYYAEVKKEFYDGLGVAGMHFYVTMKKCSLGGNNKKTLVKNLDVVYIDKIKKHSVTYTDINGKEHTKKF